MPPHARPIMTITSTTTATPITVTPILENGPEARGQTRVTSRLGFIDSDSPHVFWMLLHPGPVCRPIKSQKRETDFSFRAHFRQVFREFLSVQAFPTSSRSSPRQDDWQSPATGSTGNWNFTAVWAGRCAVIFPCWWVPGVLLSEGSMFSVSAHTCSATQGGATAYKRVYG